MGACRTRTRGRPPGSVSRRNRRLLLHRRGPARAPDLSPPSVPEYSAFGGRLRSTVPLGGLRPAGAGAPPRWTLTAAPAPAPADFAPPAAALLGSEAAGRCRIALFRTPAGLRLVHACAGAYDVANDGRDLVWHPAPDASADVMRHDVVHRVLPLALHAGGTLVLHASGVAIGPRSAIAFLADKGTGKSTLAAALVSAGARLLTDDTLGVVPRAGGADVLPGLHHLRLRDDAAVGARTGAFAPEPAVGTDGKWVFDDLADARVQLEPAPLAALYVLRAGPPDTPDAATRVRLPSVPAALALLQHAKLAPLLGGPMLPTLLDRAAAVVRQVPVYELTVARDLARVAAVAGTILRWHQTACDAADA